MMVEFEQKRLRSLWASVMLISIQDALHGGRYRNGSVLDARHARSWIFDSDSTAVNSFESICTFLDIDPDRVRAKVRAMMDQVVRGQAVRDVVSAWHGG
jgi:hypothetical protein